MGTITKELFGKEDLGLQVTEGYPTETFDRTASTGGTNAITKLPGMYHTFPAVINARYYGDNACSGATLAAAIAAQSGNNRTILIEPGTWTLSAAIQVPANITLVPLRGASIVTAGYNFMVLGPVLVGRYAWISVTGGSTVYFNDGTAYYDDPVWVGSSGGVVTTYTEAAANITAAASITIAVAVPSGSRLIGCQLRVDTALTAGELWDAEWNDGSTMSSIRTAGGVAKNTKYNVFHNFLHGNVITDATTNIVIKKNSDPGVDSFTALGNIRAMAYYEIFIAMDDA